MSAEKNTQKWLALSNSLSNLGTLGNNEGNIRMAQMNQAQSSNMAQASAQRQAEEEAKKKKKSASLDKLLSTIGGLAVAPLTGGMSLVPAALTTGAASAVGSSAGQALGGGGVDFGTVLGSGASGALTGGVAHGIGNTLGNTAASTKEAASGMEMMAPALDGGTRTVASATKLAPYLNTLTANSLVNGPMGSIGVDPDAYDPNRQWRGRYPYFNY